MRALAGKIVLLWGWKRACLAFLAGAISVLALPPFDFFAAAFVSFTLLFWLLEGIVTAPGAGFFRRMVPALWIGWCFGFGYFVAGLWWLSNALLVDADGFAWAIPLAVLGLPAFLALFYALAAALARLIWTEGIGAAAALGFGFGVAEWLRSFLFTGFPWNPIGHAALPTPILMQSASIVGVEGMNALAVFAFALPAVYGLQRHVKLGTLLMLLLIGAHAGFGYYRLNQAGGSTSTATMVRLVQPSISQSEKWDDAARDKIFAQLLKMTSAPSSKDGKVPDVVIWPETAIPFLLNDRPDAYTAIAATLGEGQVLLAGSVRKEGDRNAGEEVRYYNSLLMINDRGEMIGAADKRHLVPFGEYLPFQDLLQSFGLTQVAKLPGGFSAGAARKNLVLPNGLKLNPLICYEAIFPRQIQTSDGRADFLVNITNDAWYGNTPGPYQHLRLAQLRSVEQGLPLLRVANNGITAIVDSFGRIEDSLKINAVATVDGFIPATIQPTPYVLHGGIGFSLILIGLVGIACLTILGARSRISRAISS
jgi:apolipoprotein N-acyltransferase